MTNSPVRGPTITEDASSSPNPMPVKGDKVIDQERLLQNEGVVIAVIWDHTDPDNEVVSQVSVQYSATSFGITDYTNLSNWVWNGDAWEIVF